LVGIIETAKNGILTFDSILQQQKKIETELQEFGSRAANAKKVVGFLFKKPIINAEKVHKIADISMPSSYKLIAELEGMNILKEITGGRRSRMYVFENYLKLFR